MGTIRADPTIAAILGVAFLPADRDAHFPSAAIGARIKRHLDGGTVDPDAADLYLALGIPLFSI